MRLILPILILSISVSACARMENVGKAPELNPVEMSAEHQAMQASALPQDIPQQGTVDRSSLWSGGANRCLAIDALRVRVTS